MHNLDGQVALVTGGGRGLGRTFAVSLARQRMRVAVAARTARQVEETVRLIQSEGHEALSITADVTQQGDVDAMIETIQARFGLLTCLCAMRAWASLSDPRGR
jgi:NAD(P)-dependent dehydrogenase (short-subunit alcohol dehydrogenase family)